MIKDVAGFHYEDKSAPFGEMDIIQPKASSNDDYLPDMYHRTSESLFTDAWASSDWLNSIADDAVIAGWQSGKFGTNHPDIFGTVDRAFRMPRHSLAFAIKPADWEHYPPTETYTGVIPPEIVGFGTARLEVSGNPLQRAVKWLRYPDKQYVNAANLNVRREHQGRHIGVAILDAVLDSQPQDRPTTTYIARSNKRLHGSLEGIGYRETGSMTRTDLVSGVVIEEVRMLADSVAAVRERLTAQFSWLRDATVIVPRQNTEA